MSGTRERKANINLALDYLLSQAESYGETNESPLPITYCHKINIGPIIGRDGAICPYCSDVLKNKATLNVHMKRCKMHPAQELGQPGSIFRIGMSDQEVEYYQRDQSSPSPKVK